MKKFERRKRSLAAFLCTENLKTTETVLRSMSSCCSI